MKLSYIVPVWNVERYLARCVESIARQGMADYEVLLIDDGSTDLSGMLCDEYAARDEHIRVIHQENRGLSAARNTGLREAAGDYLLFVDADDWLTDAKAGPVLQQASELRLDVGVADFIYVMEDGSCRINGKWPRHFDVPVSGREFFLKSMRTRTSLKAVWKSIYRREFLLKNGLFFHEGYNHEDEEWTPRVYLAAERVKDIPVVFYCYFIRKDGISRDPAAFEKNALDMIHNCERLKLLSMKEDGELRSMFQDRIANLYLSAVSKGSLSGNGYREEVSAGFFREMEMERKTRLKAAVFKMNKKLYCHISRLVKIRDGSVKF